MLDAGISVERERTGSSRLIQLRKVVGELSQSSSPSEGTPDGGENENSNGFDDGCDGDDGSADTLRGESKTPSTPSRETPEEKAARAAVEIMFNIPYENVQCSENKETPNNDDSDDSSATSEGESAISEGESELSF